MLGTNFVTVTKGEEGEWDELNDAVMATLDAHLAADEPVVSPRRARRSWTRGERRADVESASERSSTPRSAPR